MRILVVEDEHRIAGSIKKGLEQENYAVDVCFSGTEGYDLASTEDYDAIILDLMLPGIDGISICKKLRSDGRHTPVLMLTAKGQTGDKVEGFDSGADDYLTKPFSFEELLARLRAIIRRPRQLLPQILKANDLTVDTKQYIVQRKGQTVRLTSKEFSLIEYMIRNRGKILTKEQIMNHVWNYDDNILPNTVEVYIKNLRSKIDDPYPDSEKLIITVRGFGYRLGN